MGDAIQSDPMWGVVPGWGSPESAMIGSAWELHCEKAAKAAENKELRPQDPPPSSGIDERKAKAALWRALGSSELVQAVVVHELSPSERLALMSMDAPFLIEAMLSAGIGEGDPARRSAARLGVLAKKLEKLLLFESKGVQELFPEREPFEQASQETESFQNRAKRVRQARVATVAAMSCAGALMAGSGWAQGLGAQGAALLAFQALTIGSGASLALGGALLAAKSAIPDEMAAARLVKACYPKAPKALIHKFLQDRGDNEELARALGSASRADLADLGVALDQMYANTEGAPTLLRKFIGFANVLVEPYAAAKERLSLDMSVKAARPSLKMKGL